MTTQKKSWEKPQLVILARGTPEESVLENCKTMNPNQPATGRVADKQDTCAYGALTNCKNCQSRGLGGS